MANQLQIAEAQFIGFHHGNRGYSVKELASAMGLKKSEWLKIRETLPLSTSEKQDVDDLFETKTTKQCHKVLNSIW